MAEACVTRPRPVRQLPVLITLLLLALPTVAIAKDDMPDRARRFRLTPPSGWQRVDLSCEEWRYDSPDGRATLYLAVRHDVGVLEPARAAARALAKTLFQSAPHEIPNPDTTYHGAPVTRLIGTFHSGSAGFTNSTAISLADGTSLLWLEVGLLPPSVGREAAIGIAETNHVAWRSLRSTDKARPVDCRAQARAAVPLPAALGQWVGEPRRVAEAAPPSVAEPGPADAPDRHSSVVPLEHFVTSGAVTDGRTGSPPDVGGSGLASHPFLTVHAVRVHPKIVAPGAEMALEVELTVSHSGAGDAELPVMLSHSIRYGERVVYQGPAESYRVPNDRRATIKKALRAATRPGRFSVEVVVGYQGAQGSGAASFEIR